MRVLFQSRLDLFDQKGGDTVQMLETKKELEKLGVKVDIDVTLNPDLSKYDLVHVFNLDWVCEPYLQIKNAKKQNKPVVLSPIHHSIKEFIRYEKEYRYGLAKIGNFLLPYQPLRDVARNLTKAIFYPPKIKPALIQLFTGIRYQQKKSIEWSNYILVQTNQEAEDLKNSYGVSKFEWKKIVNGVNVDKFSNPELKGASKIIKAEKFIVCVGRIEPRKNQLSLIKAFIELKENNEDFKDYYLVFIGAYNKHHPTYVFQFKKYVDKYSYIYHPGYLEQNVLAGILSKAEIFATPSWFETTGLVYLEAAVAGVRSIVASGNRAKEYLEDNAVYCDPGSIRSIKRALINAQKATVKKSFREKVIKEYNWKKCAKETLAVYEELINKV